MYYIIRYDLYRHWKDDYNYDSVELIIRGIIKEDTVEKLIQTAIKFKQSNNYLIDTETPSKADYVTIDFMDIEEVTNTIPFNYLEYVGENPQYLI